MQPHVSVITLGVRDMDRAKRFYAEGLGWPILQDFGEWVSFALGGGSSVLGLLDRDALAADAGVDPVGDGFRACTLSYVVHDEDRVGAVVAEAAAAAPPW